MDLNLSQNALAMFNDMAGSYQTVEANEGLGGLGTWPEAGEHVCAVRKITVDERAKFSYKTSKDAPKTTVPAVSIRFHYTKYPENLPAGAQPTEDDLLDWGGRPFNLPIVPAGQKIPDNYAKAVEINLGRLKNHLKVVLNREPSASLFDDIKAAIALVSDPAKMLMVRLAVNVDVRPDTTPGSTKVYTDKDEFLRENLSATR